MNDQKEEMFGKFAGIVIFKDSLLEGLKTNKQKHDELYNLAIDGYRLAIKEYAESYSSFYKDVSKEYFKYAPVPQQHLEKWDGESDFSLPSLALRAKPPNKPNKPSNHANEYLSAIRRVELSVYDKFELSETEFQSFVMNNWSWKNNFTESVRSLYSYGDLIGYTGIISTGYYAGSCVSGAIANF